jgi:hypothetical protein
MGVYTFKWAFTLLNRVFAFLNRVFTVLNEVFKTANGVFTALNGVLKFFAHGLQLQKWIKKLAARF